MSIVSKFDKLDIAFSSLSRDRLNEIKSRGTNLAEDSYIPPVGYYWPKHGIIDKDQACAFISSTRHPEPFFVAENNDTPDLKLKIPIK